MGGRWRGGRIRGGPQYIKIKMYSLLLLLLITSITNAQ